MPYMEKIGCRILVNNDKLNIRIRIWFMETMWMCITSSSIITSSSMLFYQNSPGKPNFTVSIKFITRYQQNQSHGTDPSLNKSIFELLSNLHSNFEIPVAVATQMLVVKNSDRVSKNCSAECHSGTRRLCSLSGAVLSWSRLSMSCSMRSAFTISIRPQIGMSFCKWSRRILLKVCGVFYI